MTEKEILVIKEEEVLERQATHLIGTLGHVAEGKSTLIRALTGVKTQRHQKEQERNITIHLGYANCKIYQDCVTGSLKAIKTNEAKPDNSQLIAHLSFVDCPGHEAFLSTMLGGAAIMDTACLIIASNGARIPMPQTREHMMAAKMMGLERFLILQNKTDLVEKEKASQLATQIKTFLKDTPAEDSPLLPISAQHGWNVEHVLDLLTSMQPPQRNLQAPAAFTCIRSFDVNKPAQWIPGESKLQGAIIGGTLQQGVLKVGDWLELRPGLVQEDDNGNTVSTPLFTQVKGIRCEQTELPYAIPGSLIAIQTTLDPALGIGNGLIGQRCGVPGTLPPVMEELALILKPMKRDEFEFEFAEKGEILSICLSVRTVQATVLKVGKKKTLSVRLHAPLVVNANETVSIKRFHKEEKRELLYCQATVSFGSEWEHIGETESPPQAPEREIVWEPLQQSPFTQTTPSYNDLLEDLFEEKEKMFGQSKRLRLKEPALEELPRKTVIKNWQDILGCLQTTDAKEGDIPFHTHLTEYMCREFRTDHSINGAGQLVLEGRYKLIQICGVLRKYVTSYKTCKECKGTETAVIKDGRVFKVRCGRCLAEGYVDV
jgi:translation initiation factor 2 subunit 3